MKLLSILYSLIIIGIIFFLFHHRKVHAQADEELMNAAEQSPDQNDDLVLSQDPAPPAPKPKKYAAPKKLPFCVKHDFLNPYLTNPAKRPRRECEIAETPCFCMPDKK